MKKIFSALIVATFLAMAGVASATPCNNGSCSEAIWTDLYNPADSHLTAQNDDSYPNALTFKHIIRDNGFDVGRDLVTSAMLVVDLDTADTKAKAWIDLPGLLGDSRYNFNYTDNEIGVSFAGLIQLNLFGELSVEIVCTRGSFDFDQSTLVAKGYDCAPVPEPGTCVLLGMGVLACGLYLRKRKA